MTRRCILLRRVQERVGKLNERSLWGAAEQQFGIAES